MSNHSTVYINILITGTSKGIGHYLAKHYLNLGYNVIGCSRSKSTIINERYKHFEVDLSIENEIVKMFREIRKEYKSITVLINNAAINPTIIMSPLLSYDTILDTYKVNVFAPMICVRESVKLMMKSKFGRIINIGSMASKHEVQGESLYTSTKSAINAYTRVISKELAKIGITVNVIAPSFIETDLSSKINKNALQEILSRNAINSEGSFDDISNIIDLLIKPESKSITGQIVYLGGV